MPDLNAIPGEDFAAYEKRLGSQSSPTAGAGFNLPGGGAGALPANTLGTNVVSGSYAEQSAANDKAAGANRYNPLAGQPPQSDYDATQQAYQQASAPEDPVAVRNRLEGRLAAEITAIQQQFSPLFEEQKRVNQEEEGRTRAGAASAGLLGSDFGSAMMNNVAQAGLKSMRLLTDQETAAITNAYTNTQTEEESVFSKEREQNIAATKDIADNALKKVDDNLARIASIAGTVPVTSLSFNDYQAYYKAGNFKSYQDFENYWNAKRAEALRPDIKTFGNAASGFWTVKYNHITGEEIGRSQIIQGVAPKPINIGKYGTIQYNPDTKMFEEIAPPSPPTPPTGHTSGDKQSISSMSKSLSSVAGQDGYVSPDKWEQAKQAWTNNGFTSASFDKNFSDFKNPNDTYD